jgi:hypothetical protein
LRAVVSCQFSVVSFQAFSRQFSVFRLSVVSIKQAILLRTEN